MLRGKQFGTKKCIICGREAKGLVVAFDDGSINGFLCFKDIQKAAENRAEPEPAASEKGRPHEVTTP